MTSSRRVKKGPGRRPQSAKRQRFMELRARGWSVRAAAREVGVSRSAATNWSRGYKTYRNGVEVGFVPAAGPAGGSPDQHAIPVPGRAHRDRRSARSGLSLRAIADGSVGRRRRSRGSCAATRSRPRVSALRCPSSSHRATSTPSSAPGRHQRSARQRGRRAAWSAVEPATDQPSPAPALSRRPVDAVVP